MKERVRKNAENRESSRIESSKIEGRPEQANQTRRHRVLNDAEVEDDVLAIGRPDEKSKGSMEAAVPKGH